MNILGALLKGLLNTIKSLKYILLVYGISLVVTVLLAAAISTTLQDSMGSSLAGENMLNSFDDYWYSSFSTEAKGLARTFEPGVVGIGAVFKALDAFLQGRIMKGYPGIVGVGILYMLLWTFFSAGFISIYAAKDDRPSFLQQATKFFPRFLVLWVLAIIVYYLLLVKFIGPWLNKAVDELTRETIDERVHFTYTVIKYLIIWFLVWSVNIIFDYSKIITVIKNHKNPLSAPIKALILVFRNFGKTYGLYFIIGAFWIVFMLVYWLIAPGANQASWISILIAFLLGQLYIFIRIGTRCLFYSGQTAMCAALTSETEVKKVEKEQIKDEAEDKEEEKTDGKKEESESDTD